MAEDAPTNDTSATGREEPETDPGAEPASPIEEVVGQGRTAATPFLLLGGVALFIWAVVAVVVAGLLLLWWLM